MAKLDERELSEALRASVPEPPATVDRPEGARRLARKVRLQRRIGALAGVAAVVLAVGLPVGLIRSTGSNSPSGQPGPAGGGLASAGPNVSPSPATIPRPCTGPGCHPAAVAAQIRKPLHLPTVAPVGSCPTSPVRRLPAGAGFSAPIQGIGPGPFFLALPTGRTPDVPVTLGRGAWWEQKVIWVVSGNYPGPLLLRGARLDGSGPLRFAHYLGAAGQPGYGPGNHGFHQLLYVRDGLHSTAQHVMESFPSDVYVRAPGCYAIQVDGEGFSEILVFRATAG